MNVYDFDGTIYDGDSTVDFFFFALKKKHSLICYIPKQVKGFIFYGIKLIEKTELKEYFFSFLAGIDAEKLVNDFWQQNSKKIFDWFPSQHQPDDIIISSSPEFLLKPICKKIGVQYLIASKVDICTGKFLGENCKGKEKVRRLEEEYHITHIDKFYSDSYLDLPLALIAEQAFFVDGGVVTEWKNLCLYDKKK